ncbi:6748_t:CDS:2, partial [Ambispora leptoticha]
MFSRLAEEVSSFNTRRKGDAWMQPYIAPVDGDPGQPFILVILTDLMKRCHSLQQAGELVYIDATAGLYALNTPLTIISTNTPIGGLPLATILTSDETTITLTKALNMLKHIMPSTAFGGCGALVGPQVIMTDDSSAERKALQCTWKKATLLLCVFHFLQAINETILEATYMKLTTSQIYLKYSHFQRHFRATWDRHKEWAIAF